MCNIVPRQAMFVATEDQELDRLWLLLVEGRFLRNLTNRAMHKTAVRFCELAKKKIAAGDTGILQMRNQLVPECTGDRRVDILLLALSDHSEYSVLNIACRNGDLDLVKQCAKHQPPLTDQEFVNAAQYSAKSYVNSIPLIATLLESMPQKDWSALLDILVRGVDRIDRRCELINPAEFHTFGAPVQVEFDQKDWLARRGLVQADLYEDLAGQTDDPVIKMLCKQIRVLQTKVEDLENCKSQKGYNYPHIQDTVRFLNAVKKASNACANNVGVNTSHPRACS